MPRFPSNYAVRTLSLSLPRSLSLSLALALFPPDDFPPSPILFPSSFLSRSPALSLSLPAVALARHLRMSGIVFALLSSLTCHSGCITGARICKRASASNILFRSLSLPFLWPHPSLCSLVLSPHPYLSLSRSLALIALTLVLSCALLIRPHSLTLTLPPSNLDPLSTEVSGSVPAVWFKPIPPPELFSPLAIFRFLACSRVYKQIEMFT